MTQIYRITATILFVFLIGLAQISAQEEVNLRLKYPEIFKISPYSYDINRLAEMDLSDIKNQAYSLMLKNDFESAARFYLYIIEHNADDARSYYDLARCYAYMGRANYAASFLILAVNNGFNNFTFIQEDEAFKSLQQNPDFFKQYQAVLDAGKPLGQNIYVKGEKLIKCRLLLPENYDPDVSYPLVIGMHGHGGTTEDFSLVWEKLDRHHFIFVIPEAPYNAFPDGPNSANAYSWDIPVRNLELYQRSDFLSSEFVVNVRNYVAANYKIGKSYLLGFSQGGSHAYATGIKNPDLFEGIIVFGSRLPDTEKYPWFLSSQELSEGNQLKVFIAHGKEDQYTYKNAIEARKTLKKNNYEVELQLFDGGHYINPDVLKSALNWHQIQ